MTTAEIARAFLVPETTMAKRLTRAKGKIAAAGIPYRVPDASVLAERTGDWDLAEECAQQAFAEATRRWPREGVPDRPGAWLTTVAKNRAIDRLRHERMKAERLREAADGLRAAGAEVQEDEMIDADEHGIEDERLRLIFTCCHPALPLDGRVALTLRARG